MLAWKARSASGETRPCSSSSTKAACASPILCNCSSVRRRAARRAASPSSATRTSWARR
ncbi:Uncharacterised protein [Bordetella pertussis]|nr:Uncharacterised protein [Bordetella pertussis]